MQRRSPRARLTGPHFDTAHAPIERAEPPFGGLIPRNELRPFWAARYPPSYRCGGRKGAHGAAARDPLFPLQGATHSARPISNDPALARRSKLTAVGLPDRRDRLRSSPDYSRLKGGFG